MPGNFISVTHTPSRVQVRLNVACIESYCQGDTDDATEIQIVDGTTLRVVQSVEEIDTLVEQVR